MASVLTEHVRRFGAESDPAAEVLPAIERLLRLWMRRRHLLDAPPRYLGYPEVPGWSLAGAFEEIVADCYIFAVLERLTSLRNQLQLKPNIDGLVSRNVKHFLFERQRRFDRVGYAVFSNVKGAAVDGEARNELELENLDQGKVVAETKLRFVGAPHGLAASPESIQAAVCSAVDWRAALPDLVRTSIEGREYILGLLRGLRNGGAAWVRCRDAAIAVAARAREDWTARNTHPLAELGRDGNDEHAAVVRLVWPADGLQVAEHWAALKHRVADGIDSLDVQQRVRDRLQLVFSELAAAIDDGRAEPPTQAEIMERTGVARATISDDFRTIRRILEEIGGNPDAR